MKLRKELIMIVGYLVLIFMLFHLVQSNPDLSLVYTAILKVFAFILIPGFWIYMKDKSNLSFLDFRKVGKKGWLKSVGIGVLMIVAIQIVYFFLRNKIDLDQIMSSLENDVGVTKSVFVYASLYITFINSIMEEFLFRGVLFIFLFKTLGNKAFWISALLFALYHISIFIGWFSLPLVFVAVLGLFIGGLFFNWLNKKSMTIYPGWIAHICADIGIMIIGYQMFGII